MSNPQPLDYDTKPPLKARVDAAQFCGVYSISALLGIFALQPALHQWVFGRRGDQVVGAAVLLSVAVTSWFVLVLYLLLLWRLRRASGLTAAAILGAGAFLPGYGVLYLSSW